MLRTDLPVLTTLDGRDVTLRSFEMGQYTVHASLPEFARIAMAWGVGTASGFSGYYHLEALTHPLGGPVPRLSADERRPWPWLPELDPFLIAAHSSQKDQLCLVVDGMEQPVADPAVGSWLRVLPELSASTRPLQDPLAILTCNQGAAAHQQLADSLGRLVWFPHGETEIWGERDLFGRNQVRVGLHRTQDGHGGQFRSTYPLGPAGDRVRWAYQSRFASNPTRWLVERSAPAGSPIPVGLRPNPFGGKHVRGLSYFDRRDWRSRSPALNASVLGSSHVAWTPNDAYQPGTPAQTDPATRSLPTTALPWHSGNLGELPFGPEDVAVVVSYFAGGRFAVYDQRQDVSYWEKPLSFGMRLRSDLAAAGQPAHRPIPSPVLLLTDYEAVPEAARRQVARGLGGAKLITVNTPSTLFLDEHSQHGVPTARIALLPATSGITAPVWTATTPAGMSTSLPPASRHHTGGALSAGSALRSTHSTGTPLVRQAGMLTSRIVTGSYFATPGGARTEAQPGLTRGGSGSEQVRRSGAPLERGRGEQDQQGLAASDGAESSRVAVDAEGVTAEQMASHSRGDSTGSQLSSGVVRAGNQDGLFGSSGRRSASAMAYDVSPRNWPTMLNIKRSATRLPLSEADLEHVVTTASAGIPRRPDLAQCVLLANRLIETLHGGRLQVLTASDDTVLDRGGVAGAQDQVLAGRGWARLGDLTKLQDAVRQAPGSTAVIMVSHTDTRTGHVLALHSLADGQLRWVDPQREPSVIAASHSPREVKTAAAAWAVLIDPRGKVIEPDTWSQHQHRSSQALLDPPLSHQFGAHGEEIEIHDVELRAAPGGSRLDWKDELLRSHDGLVKVVVDRKALWRGVDGTIYASEEHRIAAGVAAHRHRPKEHVLIPEVVTVPARTLAGDTSDVVLADLRERRNDVIKRLQHAARAQGPTDAYSARLADLFPDEDYEVEEDYRDLMVVHTLHLVRDMTLHYQFTEDMPLAGIYALLDHAASNSRHTPKNLRILQTGLQFGRDVAALMVAAQTGERPTDEGMQMLVASAPLVTVMGVMAGAYTRIAAVLDPSSGLTKNGLLAAPRQSHKTWWNGLDPQTRNGLQANADAIGAELKKHIDEHYPRYADSHIREIEYSPGLTIDLVAEILDPAHDQITGPDYLGVGLSVAGDHLSQRDGGRAPTAALEMRAYAARHPEAQHGLFPDEAMLGRDSDKLIAETRRIDEVAHTAHELYGDMGGQRVITALTEVATASNPRLRVYHIQQLIGTIAEYLADKPPAMRDRLAQLLEPASELLERPLVPPTENPVVAAHPYRHGGLGNRHGRLWDRR